MASRLTFFLVLTLALVAGSFLYLSHVKRQTAADSARSQEALKQWEAEHPQRTVHDSPSENAPVAAPNGHGEHTDAPGGHFHADGTWHAEPQAPRTAPPPKSGYTHTPRTDADHGIVATHKDGGFDVIWPPNIPNLFGGHFLEPLIPPPPLDDAIQQRMRALRIQDPAYREKVLTLFADHYNLDLDTDAEAVLEKLEYHQFRNTAILDRVSPARAWEYLTSDWRVSPDEQRAKEYARRAIAEDPTFVDARLYLMRSEPDDAVAAAEYRAILDIAPNEFRAMNGLGNRLHYDHPEEAIQILKKVNSMYPEHGNFALGMAYERLGDYKSAWVHYYKTLLADPNASLTYARMEALVEGDPVYEPIRRQPTRTPLAPTDQGAAAPLYSSETATATAESRGFERAEWQPTDTAAEDADPARAAAAQQAAQEYQRLQEQSLREFHEFVNWLEATKDDPAATQDFLSQQMRGHLQGSDTPEFAPERLIRAQETLDRYGPEEGMRRLESTDPKIAERVRRNPPRPRQGASPPRPRK